MATQQFLQTFSELQTAIDNIEFLVGSNTYTAAHITDWIRNLKTQIKFSGGAIGFDGGQYWKNSALPESSTKENIPYILGITAWSNGNANMRHVSLSNLATILSNTGGASLARTDARASFGAGISLLNGSCIYMSEDIQNDNPLIQFGSDPVYYIQGYRNCLYVGGSATGNKATEFDSNGDVTFPHNITVNGKLNLAATGNEQTNIGDNGIRWNSSSLLEDNTADFVCTIDAFAAGGRQKWASKNTVITNWDLATKTWCNTTFGDTTKAAVNGMFVYNSSTETLTITPIP